MRTPPLLPPLLLPPSLHSATAVAASAWAFLSPPDIPRDACFATCTAQPLLHTQHAVIDTAHPTYCSSRRTADKFRLVAEHTKLGGPVLSVTCCKQLTVLLPGQQWVLQTRGSLLQTPCGNFRPADPGRADARWRGS